MKTILLMTTLFGAMHPEHFAGALGDNMERHELQVELDAIHDALPSPTLGPTLWKTGLGVMGAAAVVEGLGWVIGTMIPTTNLFILGLDYVAFAFVIAAPFAFVAGLVLVIVGAVYQHRYEVRARPYERRVHELEQRLDALSAADGPAPGMVLARF